MTKHPLILSFDTATLGGSVCLSRGHEAIASCVGSPTVSHSQSLLRDINALLKEAGCFVRDVDVFAVACGPGSFTGLRIGLATAKGLAATLGRPCVGIPTLQAVASSAGSCRATVGLLPAGRGEVFAQLFSVSPDGIVIELDKPAHLSPQRLLERYGQLASVTWAGEGAHQNWELLSEVARARGRPFETQNRASGEASEGWKLAAKEPNLALYVGALALKKYEKEGGISPRLLRAMYVRPSDAEIKEQCP